mgnify:CR=1 FL=1
MGNPLLERRAPTKNPTGELRLWWGVIRQAGYDLRYGHESLALDADAASGVIISRTNVEPVVFFHLLLQVLRQ